MYRFTLHRTVVNLVTLLSVTSLNYHPTGVRQWRNWFTVTSLFQPWPFPLAIKPQALEFSICMNGIRSIRSFYCQGFRPAISKLLISLQPAGRWFKTPTIIGDIFNYVTWGMCKHLIFFEYWVGCYWKQGVRGWLSSNTNPFLFLKETLNFIVLVWPCL